MTNRTYDTIKNISLIAAPVLVFVSALVAIWNIPYAKEITATLAALDTMLGGITLVAKKIYERKKAEGNKDE